MESQFSYSRLVYPVGASGSPPPSYETLERWNEEQYDELLKQKEQIRKLKKQIKDLKKKCQCR